VLRIDWENAPSTKEILTIAQEISRDHCIADIRLNHNGPCERCGQSVAWDEDDDCDICWECSFKERRGEQNAHSEA
jgi:hypothetical protein